RDSARDGARDEPRTDSPGIARSFSDIGARARADSRADKRTGARVLARDVHLAAGNDGAEGDSSRFAHLIMLVNILTLALCAASQRERRDQSNRDDLKPGFHQTPLENVWAILSQAGRLREVGRNVCVLHTFILPEQTLCIMHTSFTARRAPKRGRQS